MMEIALYAHQYRQHSPMESVVSVLVDVVNAVHIILVLIAQQDII
jgi:hypothetical protein